MNNENNMHDNMLPDEFADKAQDSTQPVDYTPSESEPSPVMVRRKIKNGYIWACSIALIAFLISNILSFIPTTSYSTALTAQIMQENPDIEYQELILKVQETMLADADFTIVTNAICMTLGNVATFIIVLLIVKRFKFKELFTRPEIKAGDIGLAVIGILGIQGVSIYIQSAVMSLTGYTGMSPELASALSYSDNIVINIILVLYAVILGPVFEEFLFRGLALNLLAPANRKFAVVISALLFGLMHANFNQIFNAFLMGLLFGYISLKSGSIIPAIIVHICANANAFIVSYIFEERMADTIGLEMAGMYEMAVFGIEAVLGIIALVILWKRNGKIRPSDTVTPSYTYVLEDSEEKKLSYKALLTCPTFYVSLILYLGIACTYVTKIKM